MSLEPLPWPLTSSFVSLCLQVLAVLLDKFDPKSDGAARDWKSIYEESAKLLYKEIDYENGAQERRGGSGECLVETCMDVAGGEDVDVVESFSLSTSIACTNDWMGTWFTYRGVCMCVCVCVVNVSEGRNAERFAENFKDQPWIVVRVDFFQALLLPTFWRFPRGSHQFSPFLAFCYRPFCVPNPPNSCVPSVALSGPIILVSSC